MLLSVAYKIVSSALAARLRTVLPNIISKTQSGFMSNRFIGENTRLIYDIVTGQTSDEDPRSDKIELGQIMIYLKYLGPDQFTMLDPTGVTKVPNDQWKTAQNP